MGRSPILIAGFVVVSGFLAAVLTQHDPPTAGGASQTPSTPVVPQGVAIAHLADTLPLPTVPSLTVELDRYTYEPGASLHLAYAGPVLLFVETGTLRLEAPGSAVAIASTSAGGGTPGSAEVSATGGGFTLGAGDSAYAADGQIGPTRNAGDGPLVVLALLVVPAPAAGSSATVVVTATPQF